MLEAANKYFFLKDILEFMRMLVGNFETFVLCRNLVGMVTTSNNILIYRKVQNKKTI